MTEKKPYEGKAEMFAEGTGLRNLAERNGIEVVDILRKVQTALGTLKKEQTNG
jgi:hypothetical protein